MLDRVSFSQKCFLRFGSLTTSDQIAIRIPLSFRVPMLGHPLAKIGEPSHEGISADERSEGLDTLCFAVKRCVGCGRTLILISLVYGFRVY